MTDTTTTDTFEEKTDFPSLTPGEQLLRNGQYTLATPDITNLLKYVWAGSLLPTDKAAYQTVLGISSFTPGVDEYVAEILTNYKTISANSKNFKDVTFPTIVKIASNLYTYAQLAGGTTKSSYYASILQQMALLYAELDKDVSEQDQTLISKCKKNANDLITNRLKSLKTFTDQANSVVASLRAYEATCVTDQTNLITTKTKVDTKINGVKGEDGTIAKNRKLIADKRAELAGLQAEWEKDLALACTSPLYYFLGPLGLILMPVMAGVFGDKAAKAKAAIDAVNKLITETDATIAKDQAVGSDLDRMSADVKKLLDLIPAAITAIQKLIGGWEAVENDLKAIRDIVKDTMEVDSEFMQGKTQDDVVDLWNAMKVAADKYRQNAYVVTPTTATMSAASAAYGTAAAKTS